MKILSAVLKLLHGGKRTVRYGESISSIFAPFYCEHANHQNKGKNLGPTQISWNQHIRRGQKRFRFNEICTASKQTKIFLDFVH
jgi:hypothetical protein